MLHAGCQGLHRLPTEGFNFGTVPFAVHTVTLSRVHFLTHDTQYVTHHTFCVGKWHMEVFFVRLASVKHPLLRHFHHSFWRTSVFQT